MNDVVCKPFLIKLVKRLVVERCDRPPWYIALLNLVINTGSLEISAACLRALPEFIVLTDKRAYLLYNWQKKHSNFDKRSVADLVNGFDVPGISASISKVDLLWRRLFIAYCPVATKCSKWSLTHCNSV